MGLIRATFLLQSLAAFRNGLREAGSDLLVCRCSPAQAVSGAAPPWSGSRLVAIAHASPVQCAAVRRPGVHALPATLAVSMPSATIR